MPISQQDVCAKCGVYKREVNRWLAVRVDKDGMIVIAPWEMAVLSGKPEGYWTYFCGQAHALQHISYALSPQQPDPQRESVLELKPPLDRSGDKLEE